MLGKTPMFVQYKKIKDQYKNMILFYRLGDFYEMFDDDAKKASELLGLTLTARDGGDNIKVPMWCTLSFCRGLYKKAYTNGRKSCHL